MSIDIPSLTNPDDLPRFIAVEGPIGVGKTTLANRLAGSFGYSVLLEQPESNPFLQRFYESPRRYALQTELFFLFQRASQLDELRQNNLFEQVRISDFLLQKNNLFAEITLDEDEFRLYQQIYQHLSLQAPVPDLVIYLQAPVEILQNRIARRGVPHERHIDNDYLLRLNETYARFFHFYDETPLLIVNAADIDLADNEADYEQLLSAVLDNRKGRHYFNPGH